MTVTYKLIGYDRRTERQSVKFDIPAKQVRFAKSVAGLDPDQELVADCPLSKDQAKDIAGVIDKSIDVENCDFFLEPYVQAAHRRSA
jgi:hypothetical protein